jgi:hypothetical protein
MDTWVWIVIAVAAVLVVALLLLSARRARERRLESKRSEALELRKQAEAKSQRPSIVRPSRTSSPSVRKPSRRKPRWPRAGPTKSIRTSTISRAPPTGGARPLKVLVHVLRRREAESPRLLQEQGVGPELISRLDAPPLELGELVTSDVSDLVASQMRARVVDS